MALLETQVRNKYTTCFANLLLTAANYSTKTGRLRESFDKQLISPKDLNQKVILLETVCTTGVKIDEIDSICTAVGSHE